MRRIVPVLCLTACLDTTVPAPPPPPGSGVVQGTLVWVEPGQSTLRPAVGATLELLGSGVRTTSAADTGFFSVSPVDSAQSPLVIRFDADGDGRPERQRVLDLVPLKAGRGKTIALGQLTIGSNAVVRGVVRRADVAGRSGHSGTAVVVPETPFFTYTADDGSFVLDNLPEGPLEVTTFREGYASVSERLELVAGTVVELAPRAIERLTGPRVSTVRGRVFLPDGAPASDVTVRHSGGASTRTDLSGAYAFTELPFGLYSMGFTKEGFLTATQVRLVIVAPQVQLRDVTLAAGTSTPAVFELPLPAYDGGVEVDAGMDAGFDAGMDAGFDAGMDAGFDAGMDAGFDAGMDAGFDAGMDAGFDGGMDAGFDAGMDAGPRPTARITAAASVLPGAGFSLNASGSSGTPVLLYQWRQTAGPTVTFPNLHPSALVNPTLTAPSMASILRFELTVVDGTGLSSLPVSVQVPVGQPPLARISPTNPPAQIGGQRLLLNGATSSDATGTGISSYEWTVNPPAASVTATPLDGGVLLQLDMPPSVPTALAVTVHLNVTNGVGIRSTAPATAVFSLGTGTAPPWYVDAGVSQGVAGGALVTLRGAAFAPSNASFTYRWSPEREPDSGVADFILSNPTQPETTFVAPIVEGVIPRLITFTLTATDTSGTLTPSVLTAQTRVQIEDQRAPRVVFTSIDGGVGPLLWAFIEYDEPIGQGQAQVGALAGSPAPTNAIITISGKRAYTVFRPPLTPGFAYTLGASSVADLNGNGAAPFSQSFVTAASWSPAFESVGSSMAEPRPGLVVRRGPTPFSSQAFVFARRETSSWFFQPVNPFGCSAASCPLFDDLSAPVVSLTGPAVRGHQGWLVNDRPVALLQVSDFQGTTGALFRVEDAGWTAQPAPPNTIFSDGRTLSSVSFNAGVVSHVVLDGGAWVTASTIVTNATEYPTDVTATPFAYGFQQAGGPVMVILKSGRNTNHFTSNNNTPPWTSPAALGPAVEARVVGESPSPTLNYAMWLAPAGTLEVRTLNGNVAMPATGVSSFDAIINPSIYMVALVIGGQLELRFKGNGLTLPRVAGVNRNGVPGFSLNNDPSCEAARPELATTETWGLIVTWQERCGVGPWRVYVRALE
jgi:hypothetical protein